jgi:hypothetical protein
MLIKITEYKYLEKYHCYGFDYMHRTKTGEIEVKLSQHSIQRVVERLCGKKTTITNDQLIESLNKAFGEGILSPHRSENDILCCYLLRDSRLCLC